VQASSLCASTTSNGRNNHQLVHRRYVAESLCAGHDHELIRVRIPSGVAVSRRACNPCLRLHIDERHRRADSLACRGSDVNQVTDVNTRLLSRSIPELVEDRVGVFVATRCVARAVADDVDTVATIHDAPVIVRPDRQGLVRIGIEWISRVNRHDRAVEPDRWNHDACRR